MPKGIYAAASAMVTETRALDAAAHNLANAQTPGFRRGALIREDFASALARQGRTGPPTRDGGMGVYPTALHHSFSEGLRERTGATFDLALQNPPPRMEEDGTFGGETFVFYRVNAGEGKRFLTRASHFEVDAQSRLVSSEGWPVEGQGGDIVIPPDALEITIDPAGRIWARYPGEGGGSESFVDQLRVVAVTDPHALRAVNGQYFDQGDAQLEDARIGYSVHQGFVERSNVDAIHELVSLISIQRRYDAAQRALSTHAQTGQGLSQILRGA